MTKTLNNVWLEKIEDANNQNLTHFIFIYESEHYISVWQKTKWSEPVKIKLL